MLLPRLSTALAVLFAALLLAVALLLPPWLARDTLAEQLQARRAQLIERVRDADAAARLQTQAAGQPAPLPRLPPATLPGVDALRLLDAQGRTLAQWTRPVPATEAQSVPPAFAAAVAPATAPLRLALAPGGRAASVEVQPAVADLLWPLWRHCQLFGSASAASALLLWGWAWLTCRRVARRCAEDGAAQVARAASRQQALFDGLTQQLETLSRQAHADALTGLPNRRHFIATLNQFLNTQGEQPRAGLLLLRLQDLQGLNHRIGHAATDRVLVALAQCLASYPQRIDRCSVGRLNGADFALLLPAPGLAAETAASLHAALRVALLLIDPAARVAVGAVELDQASAAAQALSLADAALADAELAGGLALGAGPRSADAVLGEPAGEGAWQRRIAAAVASGRVALAAFPVCGADGRRLYFDCPLRVQLTPHGAFEPAQRWLAQAVRSRLSEQVDDCALALALAAINGDGVARCINMSAQSAGSASFVAEATRRLLAQPRAASRLWIDLPEALAMAQPALVRDLAQRWRPLGVQLALEHAGAGLLRIAQLPELGLDAVRIDGRFVNGIANDADGDDHRFLQGLVQMAHGVGMQVCAEGVRSAADLAELWALGFDAATGPALGQWAAQSAPRTQSVPWSDGAAPTASAAEPSCA